MKLAGHLFARIWMVLVLKAIFQSCFQMQQVVGSDPINSLSELVI